MIQHYCDIKCLCHTHTRISHFHHLLEVVVVVIAQQLELQLPVQSVPITTEVVSSNTVHVEVSSIQRICDKGCQRLATGRWFFPGTPVSSTNKTDRHDITEILLKVALNTINQPANHHLLLCLPILFYFIYPDYNLVLMLLCSFFLILFFVLGGSYLLRLLFSLVLFALLFFFLFCGFFSHLIRVLTILSHTVDKEAITNKYFSYIVVVCFIGGGNRWTSRKPPTCRKSLTNFIT